MSPSIMRSVSPPPDFAGQLLDDKILPTAMNRQIADRMPDAEAIEIEGAAHFVPVERPDRMNALMLDRMNRWIEEQR